MKIAKEVIELQKKLGEYVYAVDALAGLERHFLRSVEIHIDSIRVGLDGLTDYVDIGEIHLTQNDAIKAFNDDLDSRKLTETDDV